MRKTFQSKTAYERYGLTMASNNRSIFKKKNQRFGFAHIEINNPK